MVILTQTAEKEKLCFKTIPSLLYDESSTQHPESISQLVNLNQTAYENPNQVSLSHEEYFRVSRILSVLGNIDEETWPGCHKLPDYGSISIGEVENPSGLETCMPNIILTRTNNSPQQNSS